MLSLAEGVGLTLGLVLIYRLLGAGDVLDADGPAHVLLASLSQHSLSVLTFWALATILASTVLAIASELLSETVANRVTHRVRTRIYATYLTVSYQRASAHGHGEMLDTLDYETPLLTQAIGEVVAIVIGICAVLVYGGYALLLSWQLTLAALLLGLALAATLAIASRRLAALGARTSAFNERLLALTVTTVQAMRTIRLHAAEPLFIDRYAAASKGLAQSHVRLARFQSGVRAVRQIGKLAALAVLIAIALRLAIPAALAIAVVAILIRLLPHATQIEDNMLALFQLRLPLTIVARAIAEAPLTDNAPPVSFTRLRRELRLDRVTFTHADGTQVLHDASFVIGAGEMVTVRGPSGGGKTTMINLIARLYEPDDGQITVDGRPLPAIGRQAWLDRIAFSGQDIEVHPGSIFDNVRFDNPAISRDDARWALGVAHALDFVDRLPAGIDSEVGDDGLRLSGGQRQRICLARAIARRPDMLILDEATSAIESQLEARIYRAIRAALPATTILVVTHRLTVEGSSAEWLLEDGGFSRIDQPARVATL
nr:ABC transporter ATP-binding protein [Hephaestia mangrovi]